jgi:hypothetical protein
VTERLEHFRVLLDKGGIVRVEPVASKTLRDERRQTGLRLPSRLR